MNAAEHRAEAERRLALADTIGSLLCCEPLTEETELIIEGMAVPWTIRARQDFARLDGARDAHLKAAQVHATLAIAPDPIGEHILSIEDAEAATSRMQRHVR